MRTVSFAVLAVLLAGCDLPLDPKNTLEQVEGGTLRIGLAPNPPWTRVGDTGMSGVEVELLRQFAEDLQARIEWVPGTEAELFEALAQWELDVVIAGLTEDNPWLDEVGVTRPYHKSRLIVGVPAARESAPGTFDGRKIGVPAGRITAGYVKEYGAVPAPVENLSVYPGPIAAYRWQIEAWGYRPTGVELHTDMQVMAVPPGENAWLLRLERFLAARRDRVHEMLQGRAR